jgi:hypothetical protein
MTRHPAIEEFKENQRIRRELRPIVKQHIPQSPAYHYAKNSSIGNEIRQLGLLDVIVILPPNKHPNQHIDSQKPKDIRQTIPTDTDLLGKLDQKRAEVMNVIG